MDPSQRDRIRDDLRGSLDGDLLLDELSCALYATDASPFRITPAGIVRPRHEGDVQAVIRYAAEHQIPLTARGAGTNTAGACLGPGLIVDLSRHMNVVLSVNADRVRVQPGMAWEVLAAILARLDRRINVEPSTGPTSSLGGMVAVNAAGPRGARYGPAADYLLDCRLVLDSGDAVDLRDLPRAELLDGSDRLRAIHRSTVALLGRHGETIEGRAFPAPLSGCGYRLGGVLADSTIRLPRLMAGSEGTLGILTELTLRTEPLPPGRAIVLLACPELDGALRAARLASTRGPSACELLDGRLVSLLRARDPEYSRLIPANAGAALIVEFEDGSPAGAKRAALDLIDEVIRGHLPTVVAVPAFTPADAARLWGMVEAVGPSLTALRGGPRAVTGIEDVSVPPDTLPEYLTRFQDMLRRHDTAAAFHVRASAGHVHARPLLGPEGGSTLWALADGVTALANELGGVVGARHGAGLARTPWIERQSPALVPVFRELKTIFDPRDMFNPGAIVGPDPSRPAWPMRATLAEPGVTPERALIWQPQEVEANIAACGGCGDCRSQAPQRRMCPIFRATHGEEATPRAKANLLLTLLTTDADARRLAADDVRDVADRCVNCKMCAAECPARVNVPKLMLEAKAANVAEHGMDRADWAMARLRHFSAFGSHTAPLTNRLLRTRLTRWFLEKFFGIARRRHLPPLARRSFLRMARKWGWTKRTTAKSVGRTAAAPVVPAASLDRAALFVDVFANYHDTSIAEAAVRVLRHNGVDVIVPAGQTSSGMEALTQGDVETARDLARRNLRALADLAREGYAIVCPEPTSAVALRQDYLDLLDDPDARLVAGRVVELTTYLADLHSAGRLRTEFQSLDVSLGHHIPCHVKSLGGNPAGPVLLGLIPGVRVHTIDVGCSGMAGTYGMKVAGYETSFDAGRAMLDELRRPRVLFGSTECGSCRVQMEEGSGKVTLHPVQYLAVAYGLMPEVQKRLFRPVTGLVPP